MRRVTTVPAPASPVPARTSRIPAFISELWEDKAAFQALIAACFAIAAVGLDPKILDPGMPAMRAALKEDVGLRSLLMLGAVMQAGLLLLGGFVADRFRSERLMRGALAGLVLTSVLAIVVPDEPGILLIRIAAWACGGLILPFAIGAVAMSYGRAARATALGLAYGVYGAATATAPALALMNGATGSPWAAFALCGVVAAIAVLINRRMPDLPGALAENRPTMTAVALFSFGVVAVVAAVIQAGSGWDAIRLGTIVMGVAFIGLAFLPRVRSADGRRMVGVDLRPVALALAVGVVVGFAQAAPMLQLPQFFQAVQGSSPLMATIAIAPFVIALLVAGPVSGYLLQRIGPRTLMAGGAIAVGLANIIIAVVLDRSTAYPFFIVPFTLIGAGFVIATTVRTAIIFASVPRDLPASAAALNEASIGMGSRVGVIVAVVVGTQATLDAYRASLAGQAAGVIEAQVSTLRDLLALVGMKSTPQLVASIDPALLRSYEDAVVSGMQISALVPGIVAIVTGIIVFFAMGPRDPVRSVWDHADERGPALAPSSTPG